MNLPGIRQEKQLSLSAHDFSPSRMPTDVEEKVREEYKKDNQIDQREWYQEDDDSHLKNQVKPNLLQPKK
jgi:hypothetical protein